MQEPTFVATEASSGAYTAVFARACCCWRVSSTARMAAAVARGLWALRGVSGMGGGGGGGGGGALLALLLPAPAS